MLTALAVADPRGARTRIVREPAAPSVWAAEPRKIAGLVTAAAIAGGTGAAFAADVTLAFWNNWDGSRAPQLMKVTRKPVTLRSISCSSVRVA